MNESDTSLSKSKKWVREELFKTNIRPGIAIWAMVMLTLMALGVVTADWWLRSIWVAAIIQWIPDRAIKRLKQAWQYSGDGHGGAR